MRTSSETGDDERGPHNGRSTPLDAADVLPEELRQAAAGIRAADAIGRSSLLLALFDYLVDCSASGRAPKEGEIALSVFGKGDFEASQDAVVRVYVHRLRTKLEAYSAGPGAEDPVRLELPRGKYQIVAIRRQPAGEPPSKPPAGAASILSRPLVLVVAAALALGVLNVGLWGLFAQPRSPLAEARRSEVWRPFLHSGRPLVVVVGDYFLLAETDANMVDVHRLVRDFAVNSPADLQLLRDMDPDGAARYQDIDLAYLPVAVAYQLQDISLLFAGRKPFEVITASELRPERLKTDDIIYIGYLSGLGGLSSTVLTGQFQTGETFDQLTDTKSGRTYTSQGFYGPSSGGVYRDYAYISVLQGPSGNHIAVLAGTRDIGAIAAAEQATTPEALSHLSGHARNPTGFEAVYEVSGQKGVSYSARLLAATERKSIWP